MSSIEIRKIGITKLDTDAVVMMLIQAFGKVAEYVGIFSTMPVLQK